MAKKKKAKLAVPHVGTAIKYKKVDFSVPKIIRMFKAGKSVPQIALAIGYPPNCGQNRTRRVLVSAGLYPASKT